MSTPLIEDLLPSAPGSGVYDVEVRGGVVHESVWLDEAGFWRSADDVLVMPAQIERFAVVDGPDVIRWVRDTDHRWSSIVERDPEAGPAVAGGVVTA